MKLKQAEKPTTNYPNRYNFKPMLLSVGAAIVLSGCANNQVKTPSNLAGGMIGSKVEKQQSCKVPVKSESNKTKEDVMEPGAIAGGVPVIQPPIEAKNNQN